MEIVEQVADRPAAPAALVTRDADGNMWSGRLADEVFTSRSKKCARNPLDLAILCLSRGISYQHSTAPSEGDIEQHTN
jgi:hypothetical protein